jgi:hypothetical protein
VEILKPLPSCLGGLSTVFRMTLRGTVHEFQLSVVSLITFQ